MARKKKYFDKKIIICGVLAALSVVVLYLGSLIEVLDLTMSALASLLVVLIVIEMGYKYAWLTYIATSILSVILIPQKSAAIFYACFMGFYPITKSYIERIGSAFLRWIAKLVAGNLALLAMFLILSLFVPEEFEGGIILIATYILGIVAFVVYDIAITKLISAYFYKLRERLKLYKYLR